MSEPRNSTAVLLAFLGALALAAAIVLRPPGGPTADEFAAVQAQVAALTLQVAELQARKAGTDRALAPPAGLAASSPRFDDPERRVRRRMRDAIEDSAALGEASIRSVGAAIEGDPAVRDTLSTIVRDELEAEREERWERRRERMAERSRERLEQLTEEVRLSPHQREQLDGLLAQEREAVGELFRAAREDGSWMDARERSDAVRAASDERAREALDADQYAGWEAMRAEEEDRRPR
jgi:dsDNA-binding SOS-regulon protein